MSQIKVHRFTSFQIEPHARDRRFYVVGYYGGLGRACVGECRSIEDAKSLIITLNKYHGTAAAGAE